MMNEIQAIETVYNGYRFRSRLEARWAVFFDFAHVQYRYENEGYILPDSSWYLPDFEVLGNEGDWWFVECKGKPISENLKKARWLDNYPPEPFMGVIICTEPPSEYDSSVPWHLKDPRSPAAKTHYVALRLSIDNKLANMAAQKARSACFEHDEIPKLPH